MKKIINKIAVMACLSATTCLAASFDSSSEEEVALRSQLRTASIKDTDSSSDSDEVDPKVSKACEKIREFVDNIIQDKTKGFMDFSDDFEKFYRDNGFRNVIDEADALGIAADRLFDRYRELERSQKPFLIPQPSPVPQYTAPTARMSSPVQPAPAGIVRDTDSLSSVFKAYFENPRETESTLPHTIQLTQSFEPGRSRAVGVLPKKGEGANSCSRDYDIQKCVRSLFSKNVEVSYTSFQDKGDTFLAFYHTQQVKKDHLPGKEPREVGRMFYGTIMYTPEYEAYRTSMEKFIFDLRLSVGFFGSDAVFYKVEHNTLHRVLVKSQQDSLLVKFREPLSSMGNTHMWRDSFDNKACDKDWAKSLATSIVNDIQNERL